MIQHPKPNGHGFSITGRCVQQTRITPAHGSPGFFLNGFGTPSLIGKPDIRKVVHPLTASINCNRSALVFASRGALSFLHLKILGNRRATPDLCLGLWLIPSKAISKTKAGFTLLTGPNFSMV